MKSEKQNLARLAIIPTARRKPSEVFYFGAFFNFFQGSFPGWFLQQKYCIVGLHAQMYHFWLFWLLVFVDTFCWLLFDALPSELLVSCAFLPDFTFLVSVSVFPKFSFIEALISLYCEILYDFFLNEPFSLPSSTRTMKIICPSG